MLPHDSSGKMGPRNPIPDKVVISNPKEEVLPEAPYTEHKGLITEPIKSDEILED